MNQDESGLFTWVVETKLIPPLLHRLIIARDSLVRSLSKYALSYPVTFISAPAGFGKTSLLSSFYRSRDDLSISWLSLDAEDNDPVLFLVNLISALQRANPGCVDTTINLVTGITNPAADLRRLVGVLMNDIHKLEVNPLILILDDLHRIHDERVLSTLEYLVEHIPQNLHLMVATRFEPPLSLPRLRARGYLAELDSTNLRFSYSEIDEFINQKFRIGLPPERIKDLETYSAGWAAVLRLLAISLENIANTNDREEFIKKLPHSEQNVFEYLADEVLNFQAPLYRKFLLETGILLELNANLCQAVTGQQNAAEILSELHHNNLIEIIAVEKAGDLHSTRYRYHDLIADFLCQRLEQEYTREAINQLHYRAAKAQPNSPLSIIHFIKSEKWEEATQTIQHVGQEMIFMGLYDSLNNWISALPQTTIDQHPHLIYLLGVSEFQRGEFNKAQRMVMRALSGFEASGDKTRMGEALVILGAIASGIHDLTSGGKLLNQALSYPLSPQLEIMAHINRAWVGVYSNDWELVEKDVTAAIQMAFKLEERSAFSILAPHITAPLLIMPNGLIRLREYCTQALKWFGKDDGPIQIGANSLIAVFHLLEGNLQAGYKALERARLESDRLGGFVWLDINIDFGILQYALIRADYNKFKRYWESRLAHYEDVDGYREYLISYLFIQGRSLWYQNRIGEAREIYEQMLTFKKPQDIPENQLAIALMGAIMKISKRQFKQAEGILKQVVILQQQAPHSVLFGNARALLVTLYFRWDRPEDALSELRILLTDYERRNILGLLLVEGSSLAPVLKLAVERGVCLDQARWLLRLLDSNDKFNPVLIHTTGDTLTQREVEVLYLITEGMSNREIAENLVISETTVKSHLTSVFRKLDVRSRTQAIAQARALNLF